MLCETNLIFPTVSLLRSSFLDLHKFPLKQVRIQPATAAENVTLSAFAAEAPLLLGARRCRSIYPACGQPASTPCHRCGRSMGQRDRAEERTPDRYIDPAPHEDTFNYLQRTEGAHRGGRAQLG